MVSRPLRQTVGAHYGWIGFLAQRITAVAMTVYVIVLLAIALWHGGIDHAVWTGLFASGGFRLLTFLFMLGLLYHAWIGVRDIAMDYVKPVGVRLAVHVVTIALLLAYLGWTIEILWGRP
jgi:succinate dehydrogenase / fumarate reductase, membrane anchor subunit